MTSGRRYRAAGSFPTGLSSRRPARRQRPGAGRLRPPPTSGGTARTARRASNARAHAQAMLGHMPESDKRYAVLHMQRTDGRTYVRRPHLQAAKNMQLRNARAHMPYFRGFVMTACDCIDKTPKIRHVRSEEHTSELQSHRDLVCRLLL